MGWAEFESNLMWIMNRSDTGFASLWPQSVICSDAVKDDWSEPSAGHQEQLLKLQRIHAGDKRVQRDLFTLMSDHLL